MILVYKLVSGILIESRGHFFHFPDVDWDDFINDDDVLNKAESWLADASSIIDPDDWLAQKLDAPMQSQELWAAGVTYLRSKQERQLESQAAGGADFYQKVYEAARPEIFFKATRNRVVGHGGEVRIRRDSSWNVPEPELVLVLTGRGKLIGYTIGNDMSSRSIEGENPLYLPQAKTYDGCAALGPAVLLTNTPLPSHTKIQLSIIRGGLPVFADSVGIDQIKRSFEELIDYLFRECSFPGGALLMTGTGIVPSHEFTLQPGDQIIIEISGIGQLSNRVAG